MSLYVGGALGLFEARTEFRRAHASARLRELLGRLLRRCARLCSLAEALPGAVGARPAMARGRRQLRDVPLDRVVGSLDRAEDYAPGFLPLVSRDEERWARVYLAVEGQEGVPPIELVELDGEFFVEDGHHRVSVMKRMGLRSVEAYVTPVRPA